MPKSKSAKKTKKTLEKYGPFRALVILSFSINIALIVALLLTWMYWYNGDINDLTGGLQQTTCHRFDNSLRSSKNSQNIAKSGKNTSVGNVTFVNVYVSPSDLNSQCWVYAQSGIFAQLTEINNTSATNYYTSVTNFHAPNIHGQQYIVPIYYNTVTNKPSTLPY